ncbi:hypothetical protein ACP70R_021540 [Stipagrostis hirtigluma subsp. patula]
MELLPKLQLVRKLLNIQCLTLEQRVVPTVPELDPRRCKMRPTLRASQFWGRQLENRLECPTEGHNLQYKDPWEPFSLGSGASDICKSAVMRHGEEAVCCVQTIVPASVLLVK